MNERIREVRRFSGLEIGLRSFGGARAVRVVHPDCQKIGAHRHDWPFLSLPLLGGYRDASEAGETTIAAPCALLHPPALEHANCIGEAGLETITIEFDPAWLFPDGRSFAFDRMRMWRSGPAVRAARRLAAAWADPRLPEALLARWTRQLIRVATDWDAQRWPPWLDEVLATLDEDERQSTAQLAKRMRLHPAWLARSYRAATGEGLQEARRRRRVEKASHLLRRSALTLAEVAIEVGFCDQSHMNRAFNMVVGRTPLAVRRERDGLACFSPCA